MTKEAMIMQSRLHGAEFRQESREELGKDYMAYMGADLNKDYIDVRKSNVEFKKSTDIYGDDLGKWDLRKKKPGPKPKGPPIKPPPLPQYSPFAVRISKRVSNRFSATWYTPNNTVGSYAARMCWGLGSPVMSQCSTTGNTYSWTTYVDSPKVHVASTGNIGCSGCSVYYKVGSTSNGWSGIFSMTMPGTGYPTAIVASTDINLACASDVVSMLDDACNEVNCGFTLIAGDHSHGTGVYAGSTTTLEGELDAGHTSLASYTSANLINFTNGNWETWYDGLSYEGRFGHSHFYGDSGSSTHAAYSFVAGGAWITVFCSELDYTQWGSSNRFQQDDWGSCEIPFEDASGTVYNACTTVGWSQPWCGIFHTWWTGSLTNSANLEDCAPATNSGLYSFIDSDLTAYGSSSQDWNVVMSHRPMYCSTLIWCPFSDNMVDEIEPLMVNAGTDFMIGGHTHVYERSHTVEDWVSAGADLTAP